MKVMLQMPVWRSGREIKAGNVLDLDDRSAMALIAEGRAMALLEADNDDSGNGEPPQKPEIATSSPSAPQGNTNTLEDEENAPNDDLGRVAKALDNQYKRDELAEAAKAIGIEFPYDAKKRDIIAAVIASKNYTALVK